MNERLGGTVKFFNDKKGFGFIKRDDGNGDVFVHANDMAPDLDLYEGAAVTFEIRKGGKGLRAANLTLAQEIDG